MDEIMAKIKKAGKIAVIALIIVAILAVGVLALLIYAFFGVLMPYYNVPNENKYVAEYDPATAVVSQATYDALTNSKKQRNLSSASMKPARLFSNTPTRPSAAQRKSTNRSGNTVTRNSR
ncbi:MAG: hypothetical protein IIZ22_01430 [Clostridia bacterium]|nr:hypothetical protein [Clostridia bacterium]